MNNFIVAAEAVLPMFLMMGIGLLVKKNKLLSEIEVKHLNRMVFVIFFPILMFSNLYYSDVSTSLNWEFVVFSIAGILTIYLIATLLTLKIEKNNRSRGAMIQAIYRSNFVIMGIPVVSNIFGDENLGMTAVMVSIVVPIFNILAVVTLEIYRGGKPKLQNIILEIIKNPLIVGALIGILAVAINLKLPVILETVVTDMASVATPLALVVLGASFNVKSLGRCRRNLVISVLGKLVVGPAICLSIAVLLGFRSVELVTMIAIFATPTAVSSFTMAEHMDSDGELASNSVVFSSAFSCITMFLWIFLFKSLGMF